jgi:phage terminase large subunit-like protein
MSEKEILKRYEEQKKLILASTPLPINESEVDKAARISVLLGNFDKFCHYYFPNSFDKEKGGAEFGWFHKKAAKEIIADKNIFAVLEWPREHAKSVFADIFMPLYLKARGEMTGMVIASQSGSKAKGLLADIQVELESNRRYINDFNDQFNYGSWSEQHFITRDGIGFWALGRRESPRGLRVGDLRPNVLIVDDLDDDEEVKNPDLVQKSLDWLLGSMMGAMAILGSRVIMVGNRIGKKSILAQIVGDINENDPINANINHIKVFLTENPKTHKEDQSEAGVPAWKERYTRGDTDRAIKRMGYRMSQREYFHKTVENGTVFKDEWLIYDSIPALHKYDAIVTYNDPSFKDTKKNDYKAILMVGRIGNKWYIIDLWVRQATRNAMVAAHYDMHENLERAGAKIFKHWIEANFIQDMLMEDYVTESKNRNYMLPLYEDKRAKPEKKGRIEGLSVYFERGMIIINEKLRKSADFQNFKDQLLGFPSSHDDGPDAFEGAIFKLRESFKREENPLKLGGKRRLNEF